MATPLRFEPFLRPMVWGGRRLGDVLGQPLPTPDPYGEAWVVTDHALHRSTVAAGAPTGRTLRDLMADDRPALLGPAAEQYATFPWLVKFLDATDWLSVQVHPDDERVARLWPGEGGKTEAWFVLDAAPGSRVYAGLKAGVGERDLRTALAAGAVQDCLHAFEPRPGDCVFLRAGTVHAVGGGVLMAEVQQTSDATFRLFDWNRRDARGTMRELHVEQALACIDWARGPVTPVRAEGFTLAPTNGRRTQALAECEYFRLEYVQGRDPFRVGGVGQLQLLIVLVGSGRLEAAGSDERLGPGQAWVLPATAPAATCHPDSPLKALLCTLP